MTTYEALALIIGAVGALAGVASAVGGFVAIWPHKAAHLAGKAHGQLAAIAEKRQA